MRRRLLTVIFVGLFQVAAPRPALAIWGILERLSGPGEFNGPQLELRLVCFAPQEPNGAARMAVVGFESGCPLTTGGKKPPASINLGIRLLTADASPEYAGNKEIKLTSLVPAVSWSVFAAKPDADFLDIGVGVGVYWFSSEGFESFSGVILEPLRFDVHVAPGWVGDEEGKELTWAKALAQVATFRFGWTVFPSGFEADAFNATGSAAVRIPSETVVAKGLFLDFAPLIRLVNR